MKDHYPTRKSNKYKIIDRIDVVLYNKPKFMTDNDFEFYTKNGFIIIKNFFDPELIKTVSHECYRLFDNHYGYYVNKEPLFNKPRSILMVHKNDKISMILNKKLVDLSESILGSKTYIHQSRINYKDGQNTNGWNWHSDFETWHAKDGMPRMRCFTAMIAIDDNTKLNGCINFIPQSHNKFISCPYVGDLSPENEFSEQIEGVPNNKSIDEIKKIYNVGLFSAECNKGDLVLFDCNTLHSSQKNQTQGKRTNLFFVFNSIQNKIVMPFSSKYHRPKEMATIIN